jgi:hypothetical protein
MIHRRYQGRSIYRISFSLVIDQYTESVSVYIFIRLLNGPNAVGKKSEFYLPQGPEGFVSHTFRMTYLIRPGRKQRKE